MIVFKLMVSQDLNRNFANFTFNIQGAIMLCHNLFFFSFSVVQLRYYVKSPQPREVIDFTG